MGDNSAVLNFRLFLLIMICITFSSPAIAAERMAVTGSKANIRSGPGTNYQIIWQVEKYHPFKIVKKQGAWYRLLDYEGDYGWIHKSLVKKMHTVITKRDECNVRSGPGTNYRIAFTSEKGIPFKVLKRKGNWIKIQHVDGDLGWIYKTLVW